MPTTLRALHLFTRAALLLALSACGGGRDDDLRPLAGQAGIGEVRQAPGVTVFAANVSFSLRNYADLASVAYTIAPRSGTWSRPLAVSFDKSWLDRRAAWDAGAARLQLPLFGLYANHDNAVDLSASFRDGSRHAFRVVVSTGPYTGPARVYTTPDINIARGPGRVPGFDFMLVKNGLTSPVVLDTDGHLRWTGAVLDDSLSSMLSGDSFYIGSQSEPVLHRMDVSGSYTSVPLAGAPAGAANITNFHHELSPGKIGMLAQVDATVDGRARIGSILAEIDADGKVLRQWDMAQIFSDSMRAQGDNPANFVRNGVDWFHTNSAIYHAADNALLVSSREHFVVKLDYDTGAIRWLLGDTAKHWYVNHPSLRALALRVEGKAPIGQHALSITPNGELLLFNNGAGSLNQPPGAPRGATRRFSAPSRYAIDEQARSARETWTYERERAIYSDICSSVFEGSPGNYLVTYSVASSRTGTRLAGVDSGGQVAFDFGYPASVCDVAFSAQPLAWSDLRLR